MPGLLQSVIYGTVRALIMLKKIWKSFTRLLRSKGNNKKSYSYQSEHQTDYLTFRHRSKAEINLVTLGNGRTEFRTPFTSRLNHSQGAKGHPSSRVIRTTFRCDSCDPWNTKNVISVTFGCGN